ncbi:MAG: 2-phospho-L-lactate transferase [Acidobacteria bacterium]|nr:2-phospho-L-lactate transferase [Acidobacteriota bacterium]
MLTVLAGGVGAAKFVDGLSAVVPPEEITVIANTGDDASFHGLHISPDMDTIIYTLAGIIDRERGWGVAGDTFECLNALRMLGEDAWFQLGDRDLAMHLRRTRRLHEGATLSEVTREICDSFHIRSRVIPMTDALAPTLIRTAEGTLPFQEYFVKLQQRLEVLEIDLSAARASRPAPGVLEAIRDSDAVILAPSNPFISIGPILAIPGVGEALRAASAIAAVTPIVGGKALKGPADRMLKSLGFEPSAGAMAKLYRDFLDLFVLDRKDEYLKPSIERSGVRVLVTDTIMNSAASKQNLARSVVEALQRRWERGHHART